MRFGLSILMIILICTVALSACNNSDTTSTVMSPSPTISNGSTTNDSNEPRELDYQVGQKWEFTYYDSGTEFGSNTYELVRKGTPEGETVYVFESHLKLESSSACKPTTFDTTYYIDSKGVPVRYNMSGKIGAG